jgi:DNA-directed RNA polymerase subunit RPC12/RpoP
MSEPHIGLRLSQGVAAKNNARLRRRIAEILYEQGPMTRLQMQSILLNGGEFRTLPNDSSLTAMLAKNLQVAQVGHEWVDAGEGIKTRQSVYAINEEIIHDREDLVYTRPFSTMSALEKSRACVCPSCKQRRIIKDRWASCLVCQRRGL